jgi:hypothetical protein
MISGIGGGAGGAGILLEPSANNNQIQGKLLFADFGKKSLRSDWRELH